jgi:hypothetical protein
MLKSGIMYSFVSVLLMLSGFIAHRAGTGTQVEQTQVDCDNDQTAPVIVFPAAGLQATLGDCDTNGAATFFFSITASDECDPAPMHSVSLSMGFASQLFLRKLGESNYVVVAQPGTYTITVTATDASGNTRMEDFLVSVDQGTAPSTNYACNDSLNISLDEQCQRLLRPDMLLEGAIGCTPPEYFDITVLDGLPQNGPVVDGVGVYNYELTPVTPGPTTGFEQSFAPAEWSTSRSGSGQLAITPDSLSLSTGPSAGMAAAVYTFTQTAAIGFDWGVENVSSNYTAAAFILDGDGQTANVLDGTGSFNADVTAGQSLVVYLTANSDAAGTGRLWLTNFSASYDGVDTQSLFPCWGVVRARDLTAPSLECPEDTDLATVFTAVQTLDGEIDPNDPQINTALYSCLIENFNAPGQRYYEVTEFEVSADDIYTFILDADFSAGAGDMALFQGVFNPLTPCANIIGQADFPQSGNPLGGGDDPFLRLSLPLLAGQTYQLLTTTDEPLATGNYRYYVLSDGSGSLSEGQADTIPLTYPLFCEDLDWVQGSDSLQWTGAPTVSDHCGDVALAYNEISETQGDCGAQRLLRFFRAEDASGNVSNCIQRISFRRPTIDDVSLPPFTVPIECGVDFPLDELGAPSPSFTGYPYLLTAQGARDLRDDYCNIGATYEDSAPITICVASQQFVRTWTLVDWCDPTNTTTYAQIIKLGDFTPPTIDCPIVDIDGDGFPDPPIYPAASFECTGALLVPMPEVSDACSNVKVDVEIVTDRDSVVFNDFGEPTDTVLQTVVLDRVAAENPDKSVAGIPTGCHRFRYIATDDCGNIAVHECGFCIVDQVDPVASCDDTLMMSIGLSGNLRIFPTQINEGSWDNCQVDSFSVRRRVTVDENCEGVDPFFTPWLPYVEFSCCAVNRTVEVELLVVDTAGNTNTCTTQVVVEDKAKPRCAPPSNITMSCGGLPAAFHPDSLQALPGLFGTPFVSDNCPGVEWEELPPVNNLDECTVGTLIRRFRAVDASGNISEEACQQVITVESYNDYKIKFPKDAQANCGIPNPDTIEIFERGCDLLAVSVTDTLLSASGDECYKVFRTYRVVNWCEYDGESNPVRVGRDEDCDELPGDEDVWVSRLPEQAYIDRDDEPFNAQPVFGVKGTVCDGQSNPQGYWRTQDSRGFWQYTQHLLVYDTVPPQIDFLIPPPICSNNNETCRASADFLFIISDNCTPDDLDIRVFYDEYTDGTVDSVITDVFGSYPKYKLSGDYPIGEHEFEIVVEDGCGNIASATLPFEVVDCKAPTPTCINGLSLALMPVLPQTDVDGDGDFDKGAHVVFAEDFVASEYIDCSMPVTYSINRVGEEPDANQTSLVVTCDDLGALLVEIYAWDAADNPYQEQPDGSAGGPNFDFCETFVIVDDNIVGCNDSLPSVSGQVMREDSAAVADVEMTLSSPSLSPQAFTTDSTGMYAFEDMPANYSYTLTPRRDGDDLNGISTYDVALLNKHILGIEPLDSPYKRIAADVNNSGSISTLDVIQLRRVLLGILPSFPHSESWRFVPRNHAFINPLNPWGTPWLTSLTYESLESTVQQDFIAIKVGDMDLSAILDLAQSAQEVEGRAAPAFTLRTADRPLARGATVTVPVYADDLSLVMGFQGTLEVDPELATLLGVKEGYCGHANYNTAMVAEGRLPFSWNGVYAQGEARLFSLVLRAKQTTRTSALLRLSAHGLRAEAYSTSAEQLRLSLDFRAASVQQVVPSPYLSPNPLQDESRLYFYLPAAQPVQISLYDLSGQQLYEAKLDLEAGAHEWPLAQAKLTSSGVYLLRMRSPSQEWTTKLLKVD